MRFFAAALLASASIASPASAAIIDFSFSATLDGTVGIETGPEFPNRRQKIQFSGVEQGSFDGPTTFTLTGHYDTDKPVYGVIPVGNTIIGMSVVSAVIDSISFGAFGSVVSNTNAHLSLSQIGMLSLTSTLLPTAYRHPDGTIHSNPFVPAVPTQVDAVTAGLSLGALSEPISRTISLQNFEINNLYGLIDQGHSLMFNSTGLLGLQDRAALEELSLFTRLTRSNGLLLAAGSARTSATLTLTVRQVAPPPAAVPEPATWAMMIGGFALVGGAMRRRGRDVATVSA